VALKGGWGYGGVQLGKLFCSANGFDMAGFRPYGETGVELTKLLRHWKHPLEQHTQNAFWLNHAKSWQFDVLTLGQEILKRLPQQ